MKNNRLYNYMVFINAEHIWLSCAGELEIVYVHE